MSSISDWKIVLIDDEEGIRKVMKITLEDQGYNVFTAQDGEAGMRVCEEIYPHIVITDIRMPKMDGLQVLETLKKTDSNIEVIVLTAFADMDLAIRALQLDASDFITKPINDDALNLALKRAKERYNSRKNLANVIHQDKMMSLGRLAASVVHEINNPLSGVLNYIRLMIRMIEKSALTEDRIEKFKRYLDIVENETFRCSEIMSNLLTFSRKSSETFEKIKIEEIIKRSVMLSQHKLELQNIRLEIHIDNHIPAIKGDANQIQQCVINLIFNAIDAMPEGGMIRLSGDCDRKKNVSKITIKDTGTGINEKDIPNIFEPFYTTKKEGYGVGLGLSNVYGIIERHNANISVKSKPGEGTSFFIEFPLFTPEIVK